MLLISFFGKAGEGTTGPLYSDATKWPTGSGNLCDGLIAKAEVSKLIKEAVTQWLEMTR